MENIQRIWSAGRIGRHRAENPNVEVAVGLGLMPPDASCFLIIGCNMWHSFGKQCGLPAIRQAGVVRREVRPLLRFEKPSDGFSVIVDRA